MKATNVSVLLGMGLLMVVGAGCAGQQPRMGDQGSAPLQRVDKPIQEVKGLPMWVNQPGVAFSGDRRVFYGVGNSAGILSPSLRRTTATSQARKELAKTFGVFTASLHKSYMEATTAGEMNKQSEGQVVSDVLKELSAQTLVGSMIQEYWENPDRNESYALVRLDMERFLETVKSYNQLIGQSRELDAKVREFFKRNAEKAHDELNKELGQGASGPGFASPSVQRPSMKAPRGRLFLANNMEFIPASDEGPVESVGVETSLIDAADLVDIAYEDLVQIAGDIEIAGLATEPVAIEAGDIVETTYGELEQIAEAAEISRGSLEILDIAHHKSKSASTGSKATASGGGSSSGVKSSTGTTKGHFSSPKKFIVVPKEYKGAKPTTGPSGPVDLKGKKGVPQNLKKYDPPKYKLTIKEPPSPKIK